ncbi:PilZ domain-containing protein [Candidatus Omnitrophota bacterium]
MMERRRYIRIPERQKISYKVLPDRKAQGLLTRDISQGGIRFLVHTFIPPESLLEVRISFEQVLFSFESTVRVVWVERQPHSERYEVGVEFTNLPKKANQYLVDYITTIMGHK